MEAVDQYTVAWEGVRNGYIAGHMAHAYLIVGPPRGIALQFTESFLKLLFCENAKKPCNECVACRQVERHQHIDILWIEPQSKSRQILAGDVRELIQRMAKTSFGGKWKAGVVLCADRMNNHSENALLKTLEELPPKSTLLLVTDSRQSLLPTTISRCQKIVLADGKSESMKSVWDSPVMSILHSLPVQNGMDAARLANRFKREVFDVVKNSTADTVAEELNRNNETLPESKWKETFEARTNARMKEVQIDVFRTMLNWHRDVLMLVCGVQSEYLLFPNDVCVLQQQAEQHTRQSAFRAIQVIESMSARLDRNIPVLQIFDGAFRKLGAF